MSDRRSRYLVALTIALLAFVLRWRALLMLPIDYDEPVYLEAAAQFATAIHTRDWPHLFSITHTLEHPALVKLLYAFGILGLSRDSSSLPQATSSGSTFGQPSIPPHIEGHALTIARSLSVAFGVLQVGLLTLLNPIAGFFLAIHTMSIKYTSQAYLEALPAFASLLAVTAYARSTRQRQAWNGWLLLSGMALGITAASKYTYLVVGLVMVPLLVWRNRRQLWIPGLFLVISGVAFLLLDVQLWADPIGRLRDSLLFHPVYSQSLHVKMQSLPWWQPLAYLTHSITWHPGIFVLSWDTAIAALAMLGLPLLAHKHSVALFWLLLGIIVLLAWPTKWPQYTLIIAAPLCLSAGLAITRGIEWLDQHTNLLNTLRKITPDRAASLFMIMVSLALLAGFSYSQYQYSLQMRNWTVYDTANSNLPSNAIRALAVDKQEQMWAGTENGAAVLRDSQWVTYTMANSGLVSNMVNAIAVDDLGRVWFGTDAGISVKDGEEWSTYDTTHSGLIDNHVLCIAPVPNVTDIVTTTQAVWFGTEHGVSLFDGSRWSNYTIENSGLAGNRVLAISLDQQRHVWFGTWGGLSTFDGHSWIMYTQENSGLVFGTVSSVAIDSQGRVWCGTLDGVSLWDGSIWRTYDIANQTLRFNTATTLAIDAQDRVWVGGDLPHGPLGAAAVFDGHKWQDYSQYFSGFRHAPVRCIRIDSLGKVWFATLLEGIYVYKGDQSQS